MLDEALGRNEEDGAGGGIAGDVRLLAQQRDEARAEAERLRPVVEAAKSFVAEWKTNGVESHVAPIAGLVCAVDALSAPEESAAEWLRRVLPADHPDAPTSHAADPGGGDD